MTPNFRTFLEFVSIALVVSAIAHSKWHRLIPVSAIAAAIAAVLTITLWSIRQGHFDGWFIVGFFTMSAMGFVIALAIGFTWKKIRSPKNSLT